MFELMEHSDVVEGRGEREEQEEQTEVSRLEKGMGAFQEFLVGQVSLSASLEELLVVAQVLFSSLFILSLSLCFLLHHSLVASSSPKGLCLQSP